MWSLVRSSYRALVSLDQEALKVTEFVANACSGPPKECRVLDVGCGTGRYLRKLGESGFDMTGVDVSSDLVEANRKAGLHCLTAEEFARTQDTYDIVLVSHVIEHFSPQDLIPFLDNYLDRLRVGGNLIIATPLLTPYFYDDFDHVRPYHPMGILMVFGKGQAQVQYYSRNKLEMEDIWIRRSPLRPPHTRGRYLQSIKARPRQMLELMSAILFRASGGVIGESDGWVGLFKKVS